MNRALAKAGRDGWMQLRRFYQNYQNKVSSSINASDQRTYFPSFPTFVAFLLQCRSGHVFRLVKPDIPLCPARVGLDEKILSPCIVQ